jgi:hypothetical protein
LYGNQLYILYFNPFQLARFVFLEPADANNAKMGICDEAQLLGPNAKVELVYE